MGKRLRPLLFVGPDMNGSILGGTFCSELQLFIHSRYPKDAVPVLRGRSPDAGASCRPVLVSIGPAARQPMGILEHPTVAGATGP
jgi:hypothetical protein